MEPCKGCNGNGEINEETYYCGEAPDIKTRDCQSCGGTGLAPGLEGGLCEDCEIPVQKAKPALPKIDREILRDIDYTERLWGGDHVGNGWTGSDYRFGNNGSF